MPVHPERGPLTVHHHLQAAGESRGQLVAGVAGMHQTRGRGVVGDHHCAAFEGLGRQPAPAGRMQLGGIVALAGGDFGQVAVQRLFQQQLLGAGAVDLHTTHHFVLGAARQVLGIALGAEGLDSRWPAALADDRFPGIRGVLLTVAKVSFDTGVRKCTE